RCACTLYLHDALPISLGGKERPMSKPEFTSKIGKKLKEGLMLSLLALSVTFYTSPAQAVDGSGDATVDPSQVTAGSIANDFNFVDRKSTRLNSSHVKI